MAEEKAYGRKVQGKPEKGKDYALYALAAMLSLGFLFVMVFGLVSLASGTKDPFGKCVAVVEINGPLVTEDVPPSLFSEGMPGSYEVARRIGKIDERGDVGAVLFVVNSPGGSIVATNELYRAIDGLEKPKVAYFRETAASGAYYISTPADYIISEPDALTGSIGVILTTYEAEGLFQMLGVREVSIKSGEMKDMGTPARNMTEEERALLGAAVDEIFREFRDVVIENRGEKLNRAKFEEALDARVLTGRMALGIGLVDGLGSREDALRKAAELGGIEYSGDLPPACRIDLGGTQAGLFSMSGLIRGVNAGGSGYRLEYR